LPSGDHFVLCKLEGEKLKIQLENTRFRIQYASLMIKCHVPHFYTKMHLDAYWRPFFQKSV